MFALAAYVILEHVSCVFYLPSSELAFLRMWAHNFVRDPISRYYV
jgi:hypothetical protein